MKYKGENGLNRSVALLHPGDVALNLNFIDTSLISSRDNQNLDLETWKLHSDPDVNCAVSSHL